MKDDSFYLHHILECIRRIEEDVAEGREGFIASHMVQDAALRNLQTMSESTGRLPDALKATHPEIDWRRIIGFRNLLVHNYLGINVQRVWEIIERDLPVLKRAVTAMLEGLGRTL